MFPSKSVYPLSLTAMLLFFLALAAPFHGIDAAETKTMTPIQAAPKAIPTVASECTLISVSPAAAEVGKEIVLTGQRLSGNCSVYFQNPSGGADAVSIQTIDSEHMKVIVPVMHSGKGTIAMGVRNSAVSAHNVTIAGTAPTATTNVQPFEVKPSVPVLQSVSPSPAPTGQQITVIGSNLKQGEAYTAHFVSSTGKRVIAAIKWLSMSSFSVVVPDMEQSLGYQDSAPDTFFVTRGNTPSNRLPLKVLPAPHCVLTSVNPAIQWTKDYVTLNGSYLTPDCDITFYTSTGQAFPATSKNMRSDGLSVQVPDMPGGKGSISAKPLGAAQTGAKIPFEAKPLTPLLAVRADMEQIQGFGQKIMGPGVSKNYTAYSPVTPSQPFVCSANYDVYQNGSVYTYVYSFGIVEFVVTQRYLDWARLVWPDLNDSSLKYGVLLLSVGVTSCLHNTAVSMNSIKGETKHNLEIAFFAQPPNYCKSLFVYIQSKRPPKLGEVDVGDQFGQVCFMRDFMVPTP
jgi:hypothetical protein